MTKNDFKIKIFADGADAKGMREMYNAGYVSGFTTNPSLMKKAGVKDYASFAASILREIPDMPISFEVFANDFPTMELEARKIASWGKNVFVKIPIMNIYGKSAIPLIQKLSSEGVQLNVTVLFTIEQTRAAVKALTPGVAAIVSVFAGRIADTGVNPVPIMSETAELCRGVQGAESLWASTRETLNIFQAQECGVDIITVPNNIISMLNLIGKDLSLYTQEAVQIFANDIAALGISVL